MRNIKDQQLLYDNAIERLKSGDFLSGIYSLYKALQIKKDTDVELEIASAYLDVGCISEAQKYYIRVHNAQPRNKEAYLGLINCYIEDNEQELANFYFMKGLDEKVLTAEELDDFFVQQKIEEPPIKLYDSKDKSRVVEIASKLMLGGDTAYAEQLLKSVARPEIKQYTEICSLLSLLYLNEKRFDDAAVYADKVLEKDESHVFALACRILVAYHNAFYTEMELYKSKLLAVDVKEEGLVVKVAVCMMNIGDAPNAEKYLRKLLDINYYDRTTLMSMIAVCGAQNKFDDAKKYAVSAHKLFPEDVEIRHMATLVRNRDAETLTKIMSKGFDGKKWLKEIESFMVEHSALSKIENALKKDEEMAQKIKWLEQTYPSRQQIEILSFLAKSDNRRDETQRILLLPDFDLQAKKMILKSMLISTKRKDFSLFTCGFLRKYKPKKLEPSVFADAYYTAYATMAFVGSKFDKNLYEAYEAVVGSDAKDATDANVVAAVMFYIAGGVNLIKSKKDSAEIFGVSEDDFMQFVYKAGLEKNYEFK